MILAVSTSVYRGQELTEVARHVAAAGFENVCLDVDAAGLGAGGQSLTAALADRIAGRFVASEVDIVALLDQSDLGSGGDEAYEQVSALLQIAAEFDTDLVICSPGTGEDWTAPLDALRDLVDEAEELDLVLAVRVAPGLAVGDLDRAEELLDTVESEHIGLALDPRAVAAAAGVELAELLERVGDALLAVILTADDQSTPGAEDDALLELLNEYAPDVTLVVEDASPEAAAAVCSHWARQL